MTSLGAALERIVRHLIDAEAEFSLIGGLAVSVRTEPRFTRDADLAVAVSDDEEAEALLRRLYASGYRLRTALEQHAVGRLATVRLQWAADSEVGPVVDLLFASSGIEPEIAHAAERLEVLPGLTVPVAQTGHLVALKLLSMNDVDRPQDSLDLRALVRVLNPAETERARDAVRLIEARGYHRGRQLARDLEERLRDARVRPQP